MTGGRGGGVWRGDPANDVYMAPTLLYLYHTICTICTLATYLPISPRQTRAEVGLNTALGRVTLLSFL